MKLFNSGIIIKLLFIFSFNLMAQNQLNEGLNKLADQISEKMSEKDKTKVAVIEFSDLEGNITDFGRFISEELITKLFQTGKFKVIERQLLNKIISEHKLNLSGLVDPETAKNLGNILGVDAIVSGTITDLGQSLKVNSRIIATETGEIVAVASTQIFKDESVKKLFSSNIKTNNVQDKVSNENGNEQKMTGDYVFENNKIKVTLKSLKKTSHNLIEAVLVFESNKEKPFSIHAYETTTYLIDENGNRWNYYKDNIGLSRIIGPKLIPGSRLPAKISFKANGNTEGKIFNLIMKDIVINDIIL